MNFYRFLVDPSLQIQQFNERKALLYASCTAHKNDSQRSYRLLATLAGYMVVSLTLMTTARPSPLERFGLNVSG